MTNLRWISVLGVLLCLLTIGCGKEGYSTPGAVKLSGTLTDNGEPLFVEGIENGTGMIVVGFHAIVEGEAGPEISSAHVDLDGNFEIPQGIEPGEYLVTVHQWEPYPQKDLLKGKFTARKSKIIRQIDGDTVLDIDLANPEGDG